MAMTLRLDEDDERALAQLAESEGVSRQEATIRAIHEAVARRGHDVAVREASAKARERYADVLRRLGVTDFLTLEDLPTLVDELDIGPLRDVGLLESAAHRPTRRRRLHVGQRASERVRERINIADN